MTEKARRLVYGQLQDIGDVFAFVRNLERFTIVPLATAHFTFDVHIGQKMHFDFD